MRPACAAALALALTSCAPFLAAQPPGKAEITGLMDKVIANPSDSGAKERLGAAARLAAASEMKVSDAERAALLKDAGLARAKRMRMEAQKEKRVRAWKHDFSKACSMASDADSVREAVDAYETLLKSFPVYSDSAKMLEESEARIMGIFFRTIKKSYPYLTQGREKADARMLAALVFSRNSERHADIGGVQLSGMTESQLKKSEKLVGLADMLRRQQKNLSEALSLYGRKRWTESIKYFSEVLAFDRHDEEALYYRELAQERAGAEL